jgi:lipid-binding SYLF domain-containing protein
VTKPTDDESALRALLADILARGYSVSVYDGGGWPVKRSRDASAIFEAASAVEEASLKIGGAAGETLGTFLIVFGNCPDELIADYSWNRNFHGDETGPMFEIDSACQRLFEGESAL